MSRCKSFSIGWRWRVSLFRKTQSPLHTLQNLYVIGSAWRKVRCFHKAACSGRAAALWIHFEAWHHWHVFCWSIQVSLWPAPPCNFKSVETAPFKECAQSRTRREWFSTKEFHRKSKRSVQNFAISKRNFASYQHDLTTGLLLEAASQNRGFSAVIWRLYISASPSYITRHPSTTSIVYIIHRLSFSYTVLAYTFRSQIADRGQCFGWSGRQWR